MATLNTPDRNPIWWLTEYTVIWQEAEPTLRSEFERRFREQERLQSPDNSVIGRASTPRNVDVEHAHLVPDENWETGLNWDDARVGLRFGIGARVQYQDYPRWSEELEARLRDDWGKTHHPRPWQRVRRAVRRGFEHKRNEQI